MNKTKIPFADYTWNPLTGCSKVSEGCQNCYAAAIHKRFSKEPFEKIIYHPERLTEPMKVKKPSVFFVCSMADIFHPDVDVIAIDGILDVIQRCPQHIFLILTKRPENIRSMLFNGTLGWSCENLWIGVTCENQARAEERIPTVINSWSGHKWVCVEPMLGSIEIEDLGEPDDIEWIVNGDMTGPKAQKTDLRWVKYLSSQCENDGIPYFWKGKMEVPDRINRQEWPEEMKKLKEVG